MYDKHNQLFSFTPLSLPLLSKRWVEKERELSGIRWAEREREMLLPYTHTIILE